MSVPEFDTLDEMWLHAANRILSENKEQASRDGGTLEILGFCGRVLDPRANFMFNPERKLNASYAAAELLWYLSGTSDTTMLQCYAPQYKRFTDDGVNAYGAYGGRWTDEEYVDQFYGPFPANSGTQPEFKRWFGGEGPHQSQLAGICWLLKTKTDTRQAVMAHWKPTDLIHAIAGDKKDLPCTTNLTFIVRGGKLNLWTNMRSNDMWIGLPYDAWSFMCIQQLIAEALGLELGWYQHSAMSLHVYERNMGRFRQAACSRFQTESLEFGPSARLLFDRIPLALQLEKANRDLGACANAVDGIGANGLLGQIVTMASAKWAGERAISRIYYPGLRRHMEATCSS